MSSHAIDPSQMLSRLSQNWANQWCSKANPFSLSCPFMCRWLLIAILFGVVIDINYYGHYEYAAFHRRCLWKYAENIVHFNSISIFDKMPKWCSYFIGRGRPTWRMRSLDFYFVASAILCVSAFSGRKCNSKMSRINWASTPWPSRLTSAAICRVVYQLVEIPITHNRHHASHNNVRSRGDVAGKV